MTRISDDEEFYDLVITSAEEHDEGWTITASDDPASDHNDWSFFVHKNDDLDVDPEAGDLARFYGRGPGHVVRGLALRKRGAPAGAFHVWYYKTPDKQAEEDQRQSASYSQELRERFEREREHLDAQYEALPREFQERIDRRRERQPEFRWRYEAYESFCCSEAVKIAAWMQAHMGDEEVTEDLVNAAYTAFQALPSGDKVEEAGLEAGHSGNTMDVAITLAACYLAWPDKVPLVPGAIAPIVGAVECGDWTQEEVDQMAVADA